MRLTLKPFKTACLAVVVASALTQSLFAQSFTQFEADSKVISAKTNRLTGTKEYQAAADYILQRLQSLNPDKIIEQKFDTAQTFSPQTAKNADGTTYTAFVDPVATVTPVSDDGKDGTPLKLYPMRPNGIIPPATPAEGVSGNIIHIGKGTADDFDRVHVEGAIVIRPEETIPIGHISHDADQMRLVYESGRKVGEQFIDRIIAFYSNHNY